MSCTRYEFAKGGDLGVFAPDIPVIYLWADEVERLRMLLARPTPPEPLEVNLSAGGGMDVTLQLHPDGSARLSLCPEFPNPVVVRLDARHANDLRATLGILKPRESETFEAMAYAIAESYGSADDRARTIKDRADAAYQPAQGEGLRR